jgi:uncharacterized membrane protein
MKILGLILIVAGILMFVFPEFNYTEKERVVKIGKVEISKNENKTISWPVYAGAAAVVAGVILLVAGKRNN